MAIAQHRPVPTRQEQTTIHWQTESMSPRSTTMSNRVYQPLIFSIDDRLAEQHLTKLDLCSKNLKKIDKLPNNINFNVVLLDYNDITKIEHLDILTHLIQVRISLVISSETLLSILVIHFS
jgi:Leucine-rich repeat (LRR) protein